MKSQLNEFGLNEMKVTPLSAEELKENNGGWGFKWLSYYMRSVYKQANSQADTGGSSRESVTVVTIPGGNN
jgi:hypothetical protein